jgi:hypothetical protein
MTEYEKINLADELAIRRLQARYSDAVNRRDALAMENTWMKESVWVFLGNPIEGREKIMSVWNHAMDGFPQILQLYFLAGLKIENDSASGRWYIQEMVINRKGKSLQFLGVYNDTYVKTETGWQFKMRRFDLIHQGVGPLESAGWQGYPRDMNFGF